MVSIPMVKSFLACSLLLFLPFAAFASEEEVTRVPVYNGHASIEVPASWYEVPEEVLEFYSLRSAESSGGRMAEIYQVGFRPGSPELDFALPQVLIQIRESGRLKYGQFLHLPTLQSFQDVSGERIASRRGPLIKRLHLDEVVFDREAFALHLTNSLDLRLEGEALVHSVSFLTERGLFTIHCYAHVAQMGDMESIFAAIIDSVRLDDEIRYRPQFRDRWPPRPSTLAFSAAAISALVMIILYLVQRRRHS